MYREIFTPSFILVVSRQFKPQAAVITTAFSKGGAYQDKSMSQITSLITTSSGRIQDKRKSFASEERENNMVHK